MSQTAPSDVDLVVEARRGDVTSLGALLERHRAGMRAVAVSLLGWGPEADDVVQDAMLVGLQRIGELRDPAAAGAWLHTITRNTARMRLRTAGREPLLGESLEALPGRDPRPDQVLDDHALRDWVWSAVGTLSEPLQTVVLLRYFSPVSSYGQIATVCGIPVGTVRSRLSEARRRLTDALQVAAESSHDDSARLTDRRRRTAEHLLSSTDPGAFEAALVEVAAAHLRLVGPQGQRSQGLGTLVWMMNSDLEAGVSQRVNQVTASARLTLLECDLLSPPGDPGHCPPGVLWLMTLDHERVESIRLFHPNPDARTFT